VVRSGFLQVFLAFAWVAYIGVFPLLSQQIGVVAAAVAYVIVLTAGARGGFRSGVVHGLVCLPVIVVAFMRVNGGTIDMHGLLTGGTATLAIGVLLGAVTGRLRDLHAVVVAQQRQLEHQTRHDALTGVLNRVAITEELAAAMRTRRNGETAIAVAFLDLDGFKNINDTYGHATGDAVLRELGRRMQADASTGRAWGRLSGDEFLLVTVDQGRSRVEEGIEQSVNHLLTVPFQVDQHELLLTGSVGVADVREDDTDGDQVVRRADTLMYAMKRPDVSRR